MTNSKDLESANPHEPYSNHSDSTTSLDEQPGPKRPKIEVQKENKLFNPHLNVSSTFFNDFSLYYQKRQSYIFQSDPATSVCCSAEGSAVLTEPFLAGTISEVFQPKFLKKLKNELEIHQTYSKKSNDLYEFYQSQDLKSTKLKFLKKLRDAIYGEEFLNFFSKLTGIKLNNTLDASVSKYIYGNHLLCHDDDIKTTGEGRRIAFIIYLVDEEWCETDGGALELFGRDQFGHPDSSKTAKILPKWNNMAFFEIGNHSYHQVAEVTAKCRDRLSVVGWFHGPLPTTKPPIVNYSFSPFLETTFDLSQFVNEEYLSASSIQKVRSTFAAENFIVLQKFLKPSFYKKCMEELAQDSVQWSSPVGPANVRKFCFGLRLPHNLSVLQSLFQSSVFKAYIKELTDFNISQHCGELQQYSSTHYSLLHDDALEPSGLDVMLSISDLSFEDWDPSWGGGFHYIRDTESITTIYPLPNRLSLSLRSKDTLRFVKYVKSVAEYPIRELSYIYTE